MLPGGRDKKTYMRTLPINPVSRDNTLLSLDLSLQGPWRQPHRANILYTLLYKIQRLKYKHAPSILQFPATDFNYSG